MNRTLLNRRTRKLHKWLGLIVAIQVLLWISGGLIMASLDLNVVRGAHYAAPADTRAVRLTDVQVPLQVILARSGGVASSVALRRWNGQAVYAVDGPTGPALFSAASGERLTPLDETKARAVAEADYTGPGRLTSAEWLDTVPGEARGRDAPLWRLRFDDAIHTAVYVSADTGQVVARRNDFWRVFDVVWMLHIMDYDTRDDFNHPLLIIAAASALAFTLSGITLLLLSLLPRRPRQRATSQGAA